MTPSPHRQPNREGIVDRSYVSARLANAALGAWLSSSAFLWHHFESSRHNAWITGALIVLSSVVALRISAFRWMTGALAGWLFVSSFFIIRPIEIGTLCNNLFVAALVLTLTFFATGGAVSSGSAALGK